MRKRRRAEAAASAESRCGVEPAPSSLPRSSRRPRSVVLARLLLTQPSAAAELSPDRWRQAPPPPTPNHEQELPGARRTRVGAETQPGPEENVPEILDRKYFHEEGVCLYYTKFKRPPQMPSRMSDLSATCQVLLWSLGQTTCLFYCKSCYEILRCEAG